jgi:hypothetical protein
VLAEDAIKSAIADFRAKQALKMGGPQRAPVDTEDASGGGAKPANGES